MTFGLTQSTVGELIRKLQLLDVDGDTPLRIAGVDGRLVHNVHSVTAAKGRVYLAPNTKVVDTMSKTH